MLASLVRRTGDFERAEDCLQDAFAQALVAWGARGVPDRPAAWLLTAATRRAIDASRRTKLHASALADIGSTGALSITLDSPPATCSHVTGTMGMFSRRARMAGPRSSGTSTGPIS